MPSDLATELVGLRDGGPWTEWKVRRWMEIPEGLSHERRGGREPRLQADVESKEGFAKMDKEQLFTCRWWVGRKDEEVENIRKGGINKMSPQQCRTGT